jgi:hypothetical protein
MIFFFRLHYTFQLKLASLFKKNDIFLQYGIHSSKKVENSLNSTCIVNYNLEFFTLVCFSKLQFELPSPLINSINYLYFETLNTIQIVQCL